MQLTVLCLLGVAACAYGQISVGGGIAKSFNVSLLPLGSVQVDKAFGAGIGTNRRRRDAPGNDVPKVPQFLIARRSGISFGVRPRPADGPAAIGQRPQGPKIGPGFLRPSVPFPFPIGPQSDESRGKPTSTQSCVESSSSAEPSDESSSAANNEASSESSDESSSQSNNEAGEKNESSSPESNEASSDANSDASSESNQ